MNTPLPTRPVPENREAFFSRLRPLLAPSELLNVEVAYALAKHAHRWQERKEMDSEGRPVRYFEHLRSTALILIDEVGIHSPDLIIACLMHDSIEDTHDISDRMLEHLFGMKVAKTVKLLTKDPKEGYYERLAHHGNVETWIVKGCDRLSNLRTLKGCEPAFQLKQYTETVKVILPLMRQMVETARGSNLYKSAYKLEDLIHYELNNLKSNLTPGVL